MFIFYEPHPVFCSVLWLCNSTFGTVNHTNSLSVLSDDGDAGFDDDFDKMVDSSVRIAPLALFLLQIGFTYTHVFT